MAVQYQGGVVIGADSRTTTGSYIANRVTDKLTPVLGDRIFCCRSGSAADTQAIADVVSYHLRLLETQTRKTKPSVKCAATLFRQICYQNREALMAGIIVAGYDEDSGKGSVYNIPLGGSIHQQPFAIGGSGSSYIYGYCDANFKDGMSAEECEAFVVNSISLAMSRDGSSGGAIRIAIIDKNGVQRKVHTHPNLPRFWQG